MPVAKITNSFHLYGNTTHLRALARNLRGLHTPPRAGSEHLEAVMEWLCRAQDVTGCGGVSGCYSFSYKGGWMDPYPETTGYIIPTFLDYAAFSGKEEYVDRAVKMGEWEMSIQLPCGGVNEGMGVKDVPSVFVSGQVILGWVALYLRTRREDFLAAAVRATDWLMSVQDEDGKWSRYTYNRIPHTYYTRVAWALLEIFRLTEEEKYRRAAIANVRWALGQANEVGWFAQTGFTPEDTPLTHTIAYTLRGLLESAPALPVELKDEVHRVVGTAAEQILLRFELAKRDPRAMPPLLPGTLDERWRSKDRFSCLTGDAQISIIWLKLYRDGGGDVRGGAGGGIGGDARRALGGDARWNAHGDARGDARFLNGALKMLDLVMATQILDSPNPGIRGGIAGSYPLWGRYIRYGYPNWAAKFFADALMLLESVMAKLEAGEC
jgi:hypothetical protein